MKGMGRTVLYLCLLFGLRVAVELLNDHATQYLLMIIFLFLESLGIIWGLRRVFGRTAQGSEKDLNLLRRLAPSCLMLLGMVFLFCFPFTRTFAEIKQHRYEERREEVISAIEQGRLLPDRFGVVELPEGLKQISLDGEVEVYELSPERSVIGFGCSGGCRMGLRRWSIARMARRPTERRFRPARCTNANPWGRAGTTFLTTESIQEPRRFGLHIPN